MCCPGDVTATVNIATFKCLSRKTLWTKFPHAHVFSTTAIPQTKRFARVFMVRDNPVEAALDTVLPGSAWSVDVFATTAAEMKSPPCGADVTGIGVSDGW